MYRRRAFRKRRIYRRKSRRNRRRAPRRFINNGVRFFKLRYEANIVAGVSSISDDPSENSPIGWTSIANLFSYYRTAFMAIRYIPDTTNVPPGSAPTNNPIIVWHDWNLVPTPTRAQLVSSETAKMYDPVKGFKYARKMVRRLPSASSAAMYTAQLTTNGFISTGNPTPTQRFQVSIEGSTNNGTVIVTKYIAVKQRAF